MTRRGLKWGVALALSLCLHAGAAALLMNPDEEAQIAGGSPSEIAVLGDAFQDMAAAGDPAAAAEPVEPDLTEVEPVEPERTEPQAAETIARTSPETMRPVQPDRAVSVPERVEAVPPVEPSPVPPRKSEAAKPVEVESVPAEAVEAEPVETESTEDAAVAVAPVPATPSDPVDVESAPPPAVEPQRLEAEEAQEIDMAMVRVPIPTPRPTYTPPPAREERQKAEAPRQKTARKPPAQGSRGRDSRDARHGEADGAAEAKRSTAGERSDRQASAAGNAAVSNYPGKIVSRLRRSLRYPSAAKRERIRGEVHISFTVTANGGAGAIRVARSSGSSILDQAAVETVQRAAPFPAIPREAGRDSWSFTVPLAFTR